MKKETELFACEQLCREFLKRAKEYREAEKDKNAPTRIRYSTVVEHAALIRCSLDLWRALAYMRRR